MSWNDRKIAKEATVARRLLSVPLNALAVSQTGVIGHITQVPSRSQVDQCEMFYRTLTGAASIDIGVCPPNVPLLGVTLAIGSTTSQYSTTAFVAGGRAANVPFLLARAAVASQPFSAAHVINAGAAAPQVWGAIRIQCTSAGVLVSTVSANNQAFATEPLALAACPPALPEHVDLGTITIRTTASQAFTCNTTLLSAAATVNYNGRAAGYASVLNGGTLAATAGAAGAGLRATLVAAASRRVSRDGLIVTRFTTDGTGALANGNAAIQFRPYPMAGENVGG